MSNPQPTKVQTGDPRRPTVEAAPYGFEPCPHCGGEGWVMTAGSKPDRSVGWLGELSVAENCTNCDRGYVAVETPPPVGVLAEVVA